MLSKLIESQEKDTFFNLLLDENLCAGEVYAAFQMQKTHMQRVIMSRHFRMWQVLK